MQRIFLRSAELAAPAICFAFGLTLLAGVISPGDGTWQLYAELMSRGKRIYTDLGLNQQPLFPLLNVIGVKLSGGGVLASKAIFIPVVALYAFTIFRLTRVNDLSGLSRSLLFFAVFFVSIRFEAFRFDDYHALSALLAMASLYASVAFLNGGLNQRSFGIGQAVLTTAAALTRPNDGIALAAAAACVLVVHRPLDRDFGRMVILSVGAAGALFLVTMACVYETPRAWLGNSVLAASRAKGGVGLLRYPGLLLTNSLDFGRSALADSWPYLLLCCMTVSAGVWIERYRPTLRIAGATMAVLALLALLTALKPERLIENLAAIAVLAVTAAIGIGSVATLKRKIAGTSVDSGNADWSLLTYPFFVFYFGSLSTGGAYFGLYLPVAMTLLVVAIGCGRSDGICGQSITIRAFFLTLCAAAALLGATYRWNVPYSWLTYNVPTFSGGHIFRHDKRGPHILPAELAALIDPVCTSIQPGETLLSLPYSFANYYCRVPTWRNYVQTFFDTSTEARISQLMKDLNSSPPDVIFYQRQLSILRAHEVLFNHGAALPHRALDSLIMGKVASGEWHVVHISRQYPPSTWLLIETRRRRAGVLPRAQER